MRKAGYLMSVIALMVAMVGCGGIRTGSILSPPSVQDESGDYSILLRIVATEDHVDRVKRYRGRTEKDTGWENLFVLHHAGYSELYWGKYATPKTAERNLRKARAYRTRVGIEAFAKARTAPIPGRDIGPPEWNLVNANGAYTVVVAVFYDVPEQDYYHRKDHAIEYCRQLRQKGETAFYHHGVSVSTVTVGVFDESAVKTIKEADVIRVVPYEPRAEMIVQRFKYLAVNGYSEVQKILDPKTNQYRKITAKPYMAHIPKKKGPGSTDAIHSVGDAQRW